MRFKLNAAPTALRIVVIVTAIVVVFSATNLVYHVVRKPTELFSPVSDAFNKSPAETWRHYAPLFREYSTTSISPELSPRWRRQRAPAIPWQAPTGDGA